MSVQLQPELLRIIATHLKNDTTVYGRLEDKTARLGQSNIGSFMLASKVRFSQGNLVYACGRIVI